MQLTAAFSLTLILVSSPALRGQTDISRQLLARIGDQPVYEEDLLPFIGGQLFQLRQQEYELRMNALVNLLNQRLLEQEAKGSGLSTQAFLREKVDSTVPPPSEAEIEAYFRNHKDPLGRPMDQLKPQLEQTVRSINIQNARKQYIENLQRKAGVSILYERPRVNVVADPSRTRGNPDAPVTIVEFADFECPYSHESEQILKKVLDKYKGTVRLAFLDFPLKKIHPLAERAAEASRCAAEQGKFWEYHDLLLAKNGRVDPDGLREHAKTAGLDIDRFEACLANHELAGQVERDVLAGYRSGVSATPTFFINGIAVVGVQTASSFESVIESELRDATVKKSAP